MVEDKGEIGAPAASRHRATDASHQAPSGLGPDGSVSTGASCDCITEIDKMLAADGLSLDVAFMFSGGSLVARPYSRLLRKDNGRPETRRGRRSSFIATFCPFCGEKYPSQRQGS